MSLVEKIVVLPFDDVNRLSQFTKQHREIVFKYILRRLSKAIYNKWNTVSVFQFGPSSKIAKIDVSKYEAQLDVMMKWFVQSEDYESAGTCRDLIQTLKINNMVK